MMTTSSGPRPSSKPSGPPFPAAPRPPAEPSAPPAPVPEPPESPWWAKLARWSAVVAAALVLGWAARGAELRWLTLFQSSGNMLEFAKAFLRPDFIDLPEYLEQMVVTVQVALWGTLLALVAAVPLSLLAAANVAPWWIRSPIRRAMDALRSVNEMVFAMLFISAVGLGPFAGVLAVMLHNLGVFTKLFSEVVEAIEPGPVEGVRAIGASPLEEISYGVLPQVMPLWLSYSLYRFESNVRSATVLGIVGAGGIGMLLWDAIRSFDYARTSAILIVIIVAVSLLDMISARVRRWFI